jgi:hypothetical protein
MPDPNFPGMRVCKNDRDSFDPWRLPALQTENIALRFPRPDQPLYGNSDDTNNLISTQGGFNASPNGGNIGNASENQVQLNNTQYNNLFVTGTPYGVAAAPGDLALGGNGVGATVPTFPVISGITPTTGPQAGGTTVTITGNNFNAVTSVTFAGIAGTSLTIVSNTELTIVTPAQSMTGSVDITVTDPMGSATWHGAFTYN